MKIELFFDYACPYCYKGHKNLIELMETYTDLEIVWRPCEAHPRPEIRSTHSDLAIQGMYYIQENGGDIWKYHDLIYKAMFEKGLDISDSNVLTTCAEKSGVHAADFKQTLKENKYQQKVLDGNIYAWGEKALKAVPSYISGNKFIGSHDGILVSKNELDKFLSSL